MLYKLTTFMLVLCTALSEVRRNNVDTRYFIGPFNGAEFPLAVDRCLPFTIIGNNFQRATCISETEVIWRQYDDEQCTSTILFELATNTSTQNGMGSYFDFNCNTNYGDEYASIEFSVGDCDIETKTTMDAALDVCTANTGILSGDFDFSDAESIRVYCNRNIAELQYFDSPNSPLGVCNDEGSDSNFLFLRNATRSCGYMLTASSQNIFGKLLNCTADPIFPTIEPTMVPTVYPSISPSTQSTITPSIQTTMKTNMKSTMFDTSNSINNLIASSIQTKILSTFILLILVILL